MPDALQMLRDDHKKVKDLFKQFEDADDARTKGAIVDKALTELEIHAEIEEEILYPAVRQEADAEEDMMDEADEEHHVVKLLIVELRKMKPTASHYDAKFTVLAENVKHHIDEEESEMLPKAAELGGDRMAEIGAQMAQRKIQLMKSGAKIGTTSVHTEGKSPRRVTATASTNGRTPARATRKTTSRTGARPTSARTSAARSTKTAAKTVARGAERAATKTKAKAATRARR